MNTLPEIEMSRYEQILAHAQREAVKIAEAYGNQFGNIDDIRSRLFERELSAIAAKWSPEGGCNVYSFAQKVGGLETFNVGRALKREFANTEALEKLDAEPCEVVAQLTSDFAERKFRAMIVRMDLETVFRLLCERDREVLRAAILCEGNGEQARAMLGLGRCSYDYRLKQARKNFRKYWNS